MRGEISLQPITQQGYFIDALDLATRAEDYVVLEVGHAPDDAFIQDFFTATPPGLDQDCLIHFGMMEGTAMAGMIGIARGYEYPDDWWIGLMLIDPAFRNQRIGHKVMTKVKQRARADEVNMLKLAVLCANPRALKFWTREGFTHHRDAPATPESDGHDRVVLKCQL
ncbi:MAG: GNAT family N-acetyltransferase [Roseobacter sp.]